MKKYIALFAVLMFSFGIVSAQETNEPHTFTIDTTVNGEATGTDDAFYLNVVSGTYDISSPDDMTNSNTERLTGAKTLNFSSSGVKTVEIYDVNGDGLAIEHHAYDHRDHDHKKVQEVKQWGDVEWSSMAKMLTRSNVEVTATDTPNLSNVQSTAYMFQNTNFNQDISDWNVSNVQNMKWMFGKTPFNQDISGWDTSSVTKMDDMFRSTPFNQDISGWDTSSVTKMKAMFFGSDFNQDLNGWDVSNVETMDGMFAESSFNGKVGNWDTSSVTYMRDMFTGSNFNQDIGDWDTSSVTDMRGMFVNTPFNQDIGNWDISNNGFMSVFQGSTDLNQENYNKILEGWSDDSNMVGSTPSDVSLEVSTTYTSTSARDTLVNEYGWIINDQGIKTLSTSSTNTELESSIEFSSGTEVVNDSITLEEGEDTGVSTISTKASEVVLDVTVEGDSRLESDDLLQNGEPMDIGSSGTYTLESPQSSSKLRFTRNSDVSVDSVSLQEEEQTNTVDNYIPGQTADFNLSVSRDIYPDQNHDNGEFTEVHYKSVVMEGDLTTGNESDSEIIQDSGWNQLDFPNSNGSEQTQVSHTEDFAVQRYQDADYTAVVSLVKTDGVYDFDTNSWNKTQEEIDRTAYSWTVTTADSPTGPLTDLQNFFSSILESLIDTLFGNVEPGTIGTPSVEDPPTGPTQ